MSYNLPAIDLTAQQKVWLKAVVETFLKGSKVPREDIRIDLRKQIASDFNPKSIDGRLLGLDAVTPTLLGIWHVDREHRLIDLADRVIKFIRDEILPAKVKSVSARQAAGRLKATERDVRLVFMLMNSIGSFWSSASGMPDDGIGYQEIQFKDDGVIETYLSYSCLEDAVSQKHQRDSLLRSQLESERADVSSILQYRNMYELSDASLQYVGRGRLEELRKAHSQNFDLTRLIRLIEELNLAYSQKCDMSVAMLVRAIVDHIPPIFGKKSFAEVANNNHWNESHKREMRRLAESLRNVADAHLHVQIRKKEVLPDQTQVDFRAPLDVLLAEIVRMLK